jgi:hypothetical protein
MVPLSEKHDRARGGIGGGRGPLRSFFSLIVVCALGCGAAETNAGQTNQSASEVLASDLARRAVCEAYVGGPPRNPVACRWLDLPLEQHLALLASDPELAKLKLKGAVQRLEASLSIGDYWKRELRLWSGEAQSSNSAGLWVSQQEEQARTLSTIATLPDRIRDIVSTAAMIKASPEISAVLERAAKIRSTLLQELRASPELAGPLVAQAQASTDLTQAQKAFRSAVLK